MPRRKISQMEEHVGTPAAGDLFTMVDVSDLDMAPTGTNKKIRYDALVPPSTGGVERTLWTLGGANDLADWTSPSDDARRTVGVGVDALGFPARIHTIVQSAVPPTSWTSADSTRSRWDLAIPCAPGDVLHLTYSYSWTRSANSLTNPAYASPSIMSDTLLDESVEAVRTAHNFYTDPAVRGIDNPNTDAGYDYWNHGWAYSGYMHSNFARILVTAADATTMNIEIGVGPIWGNAAGIVALSAVHLERVTA